MNIGVDISLMKDSLLTLALLLALAALSFVSRGFPEGNISQSSRSSQEAAVIGFSTFRVTDATTDEDIISYLESLSLSKDEIWSAIETLDISDKRKARVVELLTLEQ